MHGIKIIGGNSEITLVQHGKRHYRETYNVRYSKTEEGASNQGSGAEQG